MSGTAARSAHPTEDESVSGDQNPEAFLPGRKPASSLVWEPNSRLDRCATLLAGRSFCSRQEGPFKWV